MKDMGRQNCLVELFVPEDMISNMPEHTIELPEKLNVGNPNIKITTNVSLTTDSDIIVYQFILAIQMKHQVVVKECYVSKALPRIKFGCRYNIHII